MKTTLEIINFERNENGENFRKGSEHKTFESNAEMRVFCKENGLTPEIKKYWGTVRKHSLKGHYKAEIQK